tara:strand:+ start:181 stop:378 length:198 start_codon:yes stop_codon:yes gene_type:complete
MKLSDQAMGAIMMALQNSLMEQTDIVPVLRAFKFEQVNDAELVVSNPPSVRAPSVGSVITEVDEG